MNGFLEIVSVLGLFFLRIGIPLLILLTIGTLIDRAYRRQEADDTERPVPLDLPLRHEEEIEEQVQSEVVYSSRDQEG